MAAVANKMNLSSRSVARRSVLPARPSRASRVVVKAAIDPQIAIGGSTMALLAVGRFGFLPFQRRNITKADSVGPKTTGA